MFLSQLGSARKHLAAVINVIANEIDRNPFLIFKLHGYEIIHELRRYGIEAISETVTIPDLASLAAAEPLEIYKDEKNIALEEIDFSVLEDMREKLLSLLTEKPVFYSRDFKQVLDQLYRKMARKIARENIMTAGLITNADERAAHYERYSNVAITLDECNRLADCRIHGEPGGYGKFTEILIKRVPGAFGMMLRCLSLFQLSNPDR